MEETVPSLKVFPDDLNPEGADGDVLKQVLQVSDVVSRFWLVGLIEQASRKFH